MTVPTAPVAPTTARIGPGVGRRSSAGPSVDDGLDLVGVQVEGRVGGGHGGVDVVLRRRSPRSGSPRWRSSRC